MFGFVLVGVLLPEDKHLLIYSKLIPHSLPLKSRVEKWHDLTFGYLGGGCFFSIYSVQDCSLPLPLNEIHSGEQRDSAAKLFKKTT